MIYNDKMGMDQQIRVEEAIAAYLFDNVDGFEGSEYAAQDAGREILQIVIAEFCPYLLEELE